MNESTRVNSISSIFLVFEVAHEVVASTETNFAISLSIRLIDNYLQSW